MTLTIDRDLDVVKMYLLVGEGFQKLESEQDKQAQTDATEAYHSIFAPGRNTQ